ncbi:MAG TPA: hypothetical protein PLG73_06125 [Candidatus Sumerlaeota bacterium]|nr:hypothetical protein [Candidatus Sumerlaeota bacterium]
MGWRQRLRIGPGEIIILMTIGILALIVITGNLRNLRAILNWLYSPYAAFIVVIMLVEYLLLKGADRSHIYRRELDAARQKRRDDLLALRQIETELVDLRARLGAELENPTEPARLADTLDHSRSTVERVLSLIRDRI